MVEKVVAIDEWNENAYWQDATAKNGKCEDYIPHLMQCEKALNRDQFVNCHLLFDVKMDDFKTKACLVAGGHVTHMPDMITYSNIVTRQTIGIALTIAMLHDLGVNTTDV